MPTSQEIIDIKENAEKLLLQIPGVTGVAVGQKEKDGVKTGEISILVYVQKKKSDANIVADQKIPPVIDGVKTDVIETGTISLRALKGGSELQSEHRSGTGTLGGFAFTQETTPRAVLLTNQHVVMPGTQTTPVGGEVGPLICSICSPCCSKVLGNLLRIQLSATVDGAIALLKPGTQIVPEIEMIGVVGSTHNITNTEANTGTFTVKMYSRKQGKVSTGTVQSINATGPINDTEGNLHRNFQNQISIISTTAFGLAGDSGSLVLDNSNRVVGLYFGGNETDTFSMACPVDQVESLLQIRIATGTAPGQVFTVPPAPASTTAGAAFTMPLITAGGTPLSPRIEKLNQAYQRILHTRRGQIYDTLYHTHMHEVRRLVNHNKRVATVWHRHQGPGWLVHFSNSIMDEKYALPQQVKSVRLTDLLNKMADILMQYGSASLRADLQQHLPDILWYVYDCSSAEQLIDRLVSAEEKSLLETAL